MLFGLLKTIGEANWCERVVGAWGRVAKKSSSLSLHTGTPCTSLDMPHPHALGRTPSAMHAMHRDHELHTHPRSCMQGTVSCIRLSGVV